MKKMIAEKYKMIQKLTIAFILIFISQMVNLQAAGTTQLIQYQTLRHNGKIEPWTMQIQTTGDNTQVTVTHQNVKKKISLQNGKIRKVEVIENNLLIREVHYNYKSGFILVRHINPNSTTEKKYPLKGNILENETLTYTFGILNLKPGRKFIFKHFSSKDLRMTEMYLKNIGPEKIRINGKEYNAIKYEMGVNGKLMSMIWPYKYSWWYEEKSHRLLKYEGMAKDRKGTDRFIIVE